MSVHQRLMRVRQAINESCQCHGRQASEVTLLAVSKYHSVSSIEAALRDEQRHFAESYLQEAEKKIPALPSDITWHFIGPIQSNKTQGIAKHFDWVHSIDRIKIAKRLDAQRAAHRPESPLNALVQVNVSRELQKSGCLPEQIDDIIQCINSLKHLKLRGFMAMTSKPDINDLSVLEQQFSEMQQIFLSYQTCRTDFDTLSMGMSGDFHTAIAYGSTMVRLGTAIFGPRA